MLHHYLLHLQALVSVRAHKHTASNNKLILVGKINLVISLQLGVVIKYLGNKLFPSPSGNNLQAKEEMTYMVWE